MAEDLEAYTETVKATGRRVEVWRRLEFILRGEGGLDIDKGGYLPIPQHES